MIAKLVCPFNEPEYTAEMMENRASVRKAMDNFSQLLEELKTISPELDSEVGRSAMAKIDDASLMLMSEAQAATILAIHCPGCVGREGCTQYDNLAN